MGTEAELQRLEQRWNEVRGPVREGRVHDMKRSVEGCIWRGREKITLKDDKRSSRREMSKADP